MATIKQLARARTRSKPSAQTGRKATEQTTKADERPPSALDVGDARKKLRLACEQIGFALAGARLQEDFETVDSLTPVLASVWSARMELGDVPEVTP